MVASARHDIVELPKLHENGLKIIIIIPLFEKCKCKKPSETHFALTPPWECKWCVCVCVCVGGGGGGGGYNLQYFTCTCTHSTCND